MLVQNEIRLNEYDDVNIVYFSKKYYFLRNLFIQEHLIERFFVFLHHLLSDRT